MAKKLLTTFLIVAAFATTIQAQTSIGIIGTAVNGWDEDVDMTQSGVDQAVWTIETTISDGVLKFRADDDWAMNWGSLDFPTGVGEQGGSDIPVIGGQYFIRFNSSTGEYTFESMAPTYASVGIIGTATPNGWDSDTDMVQSDIVPHLWTLDITLADGEMKFRADDDWAVNWGGVDFPNGIAVQDGDNIVVPAGEYSIVFNSSTGAYSMGLPIPEYDTMGIIGTAVMGWDDDVDLVADPDTPYIWTLTYTLSPGQLKFRANDTWDVDWGGDPDAESTFPTGTAVAGGANIDVVPGEYNITFNHVTGEYSFVSTAPSFETVGIIGDSTPGGWDADTDMVQNAANPALWSLNITLVDGFAKFRANDDWAVNWGSPDFPMGVGVPDGDNIPVVAGEYNVTLNTATGEYNFGPPVVLYSSIGILGDATAGGWDLDVDMFQNELDPENWSIEIALTDGKVKFRADDAWDINWGSTGFPVGTGVGGGDDIPVTAGNWEIAFNTTTGLYSFTPVSVGIIGTATPGGWDADTDMELSGVDANLWSISMELADGAAKFRKNDDWAVNWGGDDFPQGSATQDGADLLVTAGVYNISLNTANGNYTFEVTSGISRFGPAVELNLAPNPTEDFLQVSWTEEEVLGAGVISIIDLSGRRVKTIRVDQLNTLKIDVSNLSSGTYFVQFNNATTVVGKQFMVK